MKESPLIEKALAFATEKHKTQKRANGDAYIVHPIRVAELIEKYKQSKEIDVLIASSLLHDTLEDTYTSYRELKDSFGEVIASIVMELSTASYVPILEGKDIYLAHKMQFMTNYALAIKLADRFDNIRDLDDLEIERKKRILKETQNIINYLKQNRHLTNTHLCFIKLIEEEIKNKR